MRLNAKALLFVVLLTVLMTAGGALALFTLPWRTVLPNGMVAAVLTYRAIGAGAEAPVTGTPVLARQAVVTDTSVTLAPVATMAPKPEPVPGPVDYSRLNDDVLLVATTLDNFNQKLLRLIAQARAVKQQQQDAAALETGAVAAQVPSANDSPSLAPDQVPELRQ